MAEQMSPVDCQFLKGEDDGEMDELVAALQALSVDTQKIVSNMEKVVLHYEVGMEQQPFDSWLNDNMPSVIRSDDAHFVGVLVPGRDANHTARDVTGLLQAYTQVVASGQPITRQILFQLAEKFHITSGKWMLIPVPTGLKVDILWTKVALAIAQNRLPSTYAKVSTMNAEKLNSYNPNHVICIYNNNFLNAEQVIALEKGIRSIGIRGKLCYKPDVFTHCGIYKHNQWNIKPIIYLSNFDVILGQSKIDPL